MCACRCHNAHTREMCTTQHSDFIHNVYTVWLRELINILQLSSSSISSFPFPSLARARFLEKRERRTRASETAFPRWRASIFRGMNSRSLSSPIHTHTHHTCSLPRVASAASFDKRPRARAPPPSLRSRYISWGSAQLGPSSQTRPSLSLSTPATKGASERDRRARERAREWGRYLFGRRPAATRRECPLLH